MLNNLLYEYNPWWEEEYKIDYRSRPAIEKQLEKLLTTKDIVLLTGLRRVGKTTLLKALIVSLIDKGFQANRILYISVDDYLLKDKSINDVISAYRKLHKIKLDEKIIIFLDEITYQKHYRIQLKNLYDKQKVKIFASSSSRSLLRDRKGYLTGRNRIIEVPPLDFNEYLSFKGLNIKKKDFVVREANFEEYLQTGGMPEYVLHGDRGYLTALIEDIINKDIIAFNKIKNSHIIKDYFKLLMERSGKQISINKVANILGIATDTANRYLDMFQECFLIYTIRRYGKTNDGILSPRKIYAADLGMRHLITGFRDKGAAFENYVFCKIKHLDPRYYYEDGIEIDFLTSGNTLIEVKYNNLLQGKQKELFYKIQAKKKVIIKTIDDLELLDDLK